MPNINSMSQFGSKSNQVFSESNRTDTMRVGVQGEAPISGIRSVGSAGGLRDAKLGGYSRGVSGGGMMGNAGVSRGASLGGTGAGGGIRSGGGIGMGGMGGAMKFGGGGGVFGGKIT